MHLQPTHDFDNDYIWLKKSFHHHHVSQVRLTTERGPSGRAAIHFFGFAESRVRKTQQIWGSNRSAKAVISKRCLTLGYVNMAEESVKCKLQDVAMSWDFGSMQIGRKPRGKIQMFVTGDRTVSLQNFMTGDGQPAWRSQLVTKPRKGSRAVNSSSINRHCSATRRSIQSFRP